MTKRALIVIAVLILIPVVAVLVAYGKWKDSNRVVASYGDSVDQVIYGDLTLNKIDGTDNYVFRIGKYLGKVGDRLFGSQLYTVKDDEDGFFYVLAGTDGQVLLSENGRMPKGSVVEDLSAGKVTRAVLGNYLGFTDYSEDIRILANDLPDAETVRFTPEDYKEGEAVSYRYRACFNSYPVATEDCGFFAYLKEKKRWLYITASAEETAKEDYKNGTDEKLTYTAFVVDMPARQRLLDRLSSGENHSKDGTVISE